MIHFETQKLTIGTLLISACIGLTGCTQFQTSLASPGTSNNNSGDPGITSQSTGPVLHRAGIATSSAQIAQDAIQVIRNFSPGSSSASCDANLNCTLDVAPAIFDTYFSISSAQFADYRGQTMGGGYEFIVSVPNATASFSEPGVRFLNSSSTGFDFASRTLSPLAITANMSDMTFEVNGGALELIDNTNQYFASLTADHVTFDSSCKCPVAGSFTGNLSGSFSGSLSVTFNSCGSISITAAGNTSTASVSSCHL